FTWALIPVGLVLVWVWVLWERRYARRGHSPMVDLGIFSTRNFSHGSILVTLYFMGMTSIWVLVALYMQDGAGHSALEAGLVVMPAALISSFSADWAGKRVTRYGRKVVIGGLLFALAGLALSTLVVLAHQWW